MLADAPMAPPNGIIPALISTGGYRMRFGTGSRFLIQAWTTGLQEMLTET